jgi:glutamate-ammonia-ligase adenylyltransferase
MRIGYDFSMRQKRNTIEQHVEELVRNVIDGDGPDVRSRLIELGFRPTPSLVEAFSKIAGELGPQAELRRSLAVLLLDLLQAPYPTGALVNFLRYLEVSGFSNVLLNTAATGKPIREILAIIFGTSQYMSDIVIRNPGYLYWLIEKRTWEEEDTVSHYETLIAEDLVNFASVESKLNALRRFQRRMLLRIGVKDLMGMSSIEATTLSLSNLAQAVIRVVLDVVWFDLASGRDPESRAGFAVLALGKLGGEELNYSSDIDLIYICEDTNDETIAILNKLATKLTGALSEVTPEGYLYRVDLRLRPDGSAGPLVNPETSLRLYYENRGRPWEFQAMLKARVIAGDRGQGNRFLEMISRLIFNPSLPYSPVEDIEVMRMRIRENISLRDRSSNIKLMEGGIRDIEFITQTLQLLHGNDHREIRTHNTITAVERIHRRKLIKKMEKKVLLDAYRFFRLVEHRLQMMHQLKTHSIPESGEEIDLLAKRCSRGPMKPFTYESFLDTLTRHLNKIRLLSDSFFSGDRIPEPSLLLLLPEKDATVREILRGYGIQDADRAESILRALAYGSFPRLHDRSTRSSFKKLLPLLLEGFSKAGNPDATLINFSNIAAAIRSEATFFGFLAESASARTLINKMAATSSVLTGRLCHHLELLDTLVEAPESLLSIPSHGAEALEHYLRHLRESPEQARRSSVFQDFIDRRLIGAWAKDLQGQSFPEVFTDTLTASTRHLIAFTFERLLEKEQDVALLALGSFAVNEPRFLSDVDLLVVTDGEDIEGTTRGMHALIRLFSENNIFRLDFRLRGEGANAPLVQSLEFYKVYFETRLSTWEKIALSKCRCWSGDHRLSAEYLELLSSTLIPPFSPEEIQTLLETRKRLEGLVSPHNSALETKRSKGGRYDIEYLCAIGIPLLGGFTTYPFGAGTTERVKMLEEGNLISSEESAALIDAFRMYSRIDDLMELQGYSLPTAQEKLRAISDYLERTFELLGFGIDAGIVRELERRKGQVRACFERFINATLG